MGRDNLKDIDIWEVLVKIYGTSPKQLFKIIRVNREINAKIILYAPGPSSSLSSLYTAPRAEFNT